MDKKQKGGDVRFTNRLSMVNGVFISDSAPPSALHSPPFNIRKHKLYHTWRNMHRRCDPNSPNELYIKNYGGRGVTICKEWSSYEAFYEWATNKEFNGRWFDGAHLDKDTLKIGNLIYCPEFCKFVTPAENHGTRVNVKLYEYHGEMLSIPKIAKKIGVSPATLAARLNTGSNELDPYRKEIGEYRITRHNELFTVADISSVSHLFTKRHGRSKIWELDGFALTWHEWSLVSGVSVVTIRLRVKRGMTLREALRTPVKQDGRNRGSVNG